MTILNVFLLSSQNAAVTSQDLISRKIKEYNMIRYAGLHIAPWGPSKYLTTHLLTYCYANLLLIFLYNVCFALCLDQCPQQQVGTIPQNLPPVPQHQTSLPGR